MAPVAAVFSAVTNIFFTIYFVFTFVTDVFFFVADTFKLISFSTLVFCITHIFTAIAKRWIAYSSIRTSRR